MDDVFIYVTRVTRFYPTSGILKTGLNFFLLKIKTKRKELIALDIFRRIGLNMIRIILRQ